MSSDAATLYLSAFIDELVRSGLKHIVVSPGSRSTPLAVLAAEHQLLKVWMNIDERSAAFFALGLAKATKEAVALLCTSGTAAANYFPAITEANLSRVPLVVLTADRPHELRDVGAPQTINQIGLYGDHVKWFSEMPIPEATDSLLRHARVIAARAVMTAQHEPSGAVHLNFPLREPLLPNLQHPELFGAGRQENAPYVQVQHGNAAASEDDIDQLAEQLKHIERGVIVCGPIEDAKLGQALLKLAQALQYPIVADPLSQLRGGVQQSEQALIIDRYDSFLRDADVVQALQPQLFLRFGAMPVSKPMLQYMNQFPEARHISIDEAGWRDPTLLISDRWLVNPVTFCQQLTSVVQRKGKNSSISTSWTTQWQKLNAVTAEVLAQEIDANTNSLFEGRVVTELQRLMAEGSTLFVGNSMPIRDVDSFYTKQDKPIRIMANRGANGIDGLVSTAIGISASGARTVLLLGDLSFYHDLNGLLAAKLYQLNITIVVVNNDGGGIFSFLPQANLPNHYEMLFGTPVGLDYEHAVRMYGGTFTRIQHWEQFAEAFECSEQQGGLHVIEVPTDRKTNVALHRQIWPKMSKALRNLL